MPASVSAARGADAPGRAVAAEVSAQATTPAAEVAARVDAPAGPGAPTPTAPTSPAPVVTSAPPPPVAQQLVEHVSPLVDGPDGTHELTIELRPATLGRVQLEITLEDGLLHVRVQADDPSSRRLLAQSLGELRAALTDAGIRAGNLDIDNPRDGQRGDGGAGDGQVPHRPSAPGTGAPPTNDTRSPTRHRDGTALDVLL